MATEFEIDYLSDFTKIVAPKMVRAGMDILAPELKKNLDGAIGKNLKHKSQSTGRLQRSVRVSHVFHNNGATQFKSNIYFEGGGMGRHNNQWKAVIKEYGTGRQNPSYFIRKSIARTKNRVENAMAQALENELTVDKEVL